MSDKIETHKQYLLEHPLNSQEANLRMRNTPDGPLAARWTKETEVCPVCKSKALDKFIGGPDVQQGEVKRTEFIYDCRVCGLNITEEEYRGQ